MVIEVGGWTVARVNDLNWGAYCRKDRNGAPRWEAYFPNPWLALVWVAGKVDGGRRVNARQAAREMRDEHDRFAAELKEVLGSCGISTD